MLVVHPLELLLARDALDLEVHVELRVLDLLLVRFLLAVFIQLIIHVLLGPIAVSGD